MMNRSKHVVVYKVNEIQKIQNWLLQQQLWYLLQWIQAYEEPGFPRIESLRFVRAIADSDGVCLSIQPTFSIQNNLVAYGDSVEIIVAIRLPAGYPEEGPFMTCIQGGEHLPIDAFNNGKLLEVCESKIWTAPNALILLLQDICAKLADLNKQALRACSSSTGSPLKSIAVDVRYEDSTKSLTIEEAMSVNDLIMRIRAELFIPEGKDLRLYYSSRNRVEQPLVANKDVLDMFSNESTSFTLRVQAIAKSTLRACEISEAASESAPQAKPEVTCNSISSLYTRQILWSELAIGDCIGSGSSCCVYKAYWKGMEVAVKTFTGVDRKNMEKEFYAEAATISLIGCHPSIILCYGLCPRPLAFVLERASISLFEYIHGSNLDFALPSAWIKRIAMMLDIAKGLQFLHAYNIIHRDLKSLNILVTTERRVKIADFGSSRVTQGKQHMTGCCGTIQWMAPEVIISADYSTSADIYSFGVVLWELCERSTPFPDMPQSYVPVKVVKEKLRPSITNKTPLQMQKMIKACWQEDPDLRPSATQLLNAIESLQLNMLKDPLFLIFMQ